MSDQPADPTGSAGAFGEQPGRGYTQRMRLVITADLHYSPAHEAIHRQFAVDVAALKPDCFVIAGDAGATPARFRAALHHYHALPCARLVLPGNHDLYVHPRNPHAGSNAAAYPAATDVHHGLPDSRTLWLDLLPRIAHDEGFGWLETEARVLGSTAICGTMAWYDYSSAPRHLGMDHEQLRSFKGLVNHDADYVRWPWSDRAVAHALARRLAAQMAPLQANPSVARVVVVTHMPPFAQPIPVHPESEYWSLVSAYLGNYTLGAWLRAQPKVSHVISGHLHRGSTWQIAGADGPIHFAVVESRAGAPGYVLLDLPD